MNFAIIQAMGRQFFIKRFEIFSIPNTKRNISNKVLVFKKILFLKKAGTIQLGKPMLESVSLFCKVIESKLSKKIVILKIKRKKNYRRKQGYREAILYLRSL